MDTPTPNSAPGDDPSQDGTEQHAAPPRWAPAPVPPVEQPMPTGSSWVPPQRPPGLSWAPPEPASGSAPETAFDEQREATSSRLRNVTMGVATIGFVAVGGFAVLAANGFNGIDSATTDGSSTTGGAANPGLNTGDDAQPGTSAAPGDPGDIGQPPAFDGDGTDGNGFFAPDGNGFFAPNDGGVQPNGNAVNPPSVGNRPGHVSSGGS